LFLYQICIFCSFYLDLYIISGFDGCYEGSCYIVLTDFYNWLDAKVRYVFSLYKQSRILSRKHI